MQRHGMLAVLLAQVRAGVVGADMRVQAEVECVDRGWSHPWRGQ